MKIQRTKLQPGFMATQTVPVYPGYVSACATDIGEAIATCQKRYVEFMAQPRFNKVRSAQKLFVASMFPGVHKVGIRVVR